jgi:hypothetical protein
MIRVPARSARAYRGVPAMDFTAHSLARLSTGSLANSALPRGSSRAT